MSNIKAQRFIKALFNLCLDHGFIVGGLGVEDWGHVEELPGNILHSIIYDEKSGRFCMLPMSEVNYLYEQFPYAFVWSQDWEG